jgi:DUF1009 family protein
MNSLWKVSIDDYLKVVEIAKELGRKPGESIEDVFLAYMEMKGMKPISANEFNKDELLQQLAEKNGNVLDIATDKEGKQSYKIVKKVEPTLDNDIPDMV